MPRRPRESPRRCDRYDDRRRTPQHFIVLIDEANRVGTEARYRAADGKGGGSIVARFGDTVVVPKGNLDRIALVELAHAVTAHLGETRHSPSEAHRSQ